MEPREIEGAFPSYSNINIKDINELKRKLIELSSKQQKKDKIDLSNEAKKISEYIKIIKNMPDVRKDRIREVQKKLLSGEYESQKILEKTLEKLLKEIL